MIPTEDEEKPRVLVLIAALKDPPLSTIRSLTSQTLPPKDIIVIGGYPSALMDLPEKVIKITSAPDLRLCLGKRVSKALNKAFFSVNLSDYDFILKADSDIIFPPDFLRKNVNSEYDLMGDGCGMLIKVRSFVKALEGHFPEICADDVYLIYSFKVNKLRVLTWRWVSPATRIKGPAYLWRRMFEIGEDYFRMGVVSPIFLIGILKLSIERGLIYVFLLLGYITALLQRMPKYPIASSVFINKAISFKINFKKNLRSLLKFNKR